MGILMERQQLFARHVAALINFIFEHKFACTLGEAFRTAEQAEIYSHEGKGIKNSLHCKRLAIDLNIFTTEERYLPSSNEYRIFGSYWKSLHPDNRWGGDFIERPDGNHFETKDPNHD
jgi:hypothetical protein